MPDDIVLTDQQERAAGHEMGRLRVIACPGSGKTEIIARRIANLIKNGSPPQGIAAITFTEKAAGELKLRIRKILDSEFPQRADFGDLFIGTIHAFCLEMLREMDPVYRTYDILDGPRRVAFLAKYGNYYHNIGLVRLEKKHGLRFYQTVRQFMRSADIMLTESINPDNLTDTSFAEVFRNYISELDAQRYFDFPSIISRLVSTLEGDRGKLDLIEHRIRHVIVDEFQDVDPLQGKLLDIISERAQSVAVVGDDDQGIYHWRGTDVSIIIDFGSETKGACTDVKLETNFRSTPEIVDLASVFISNNRRRLSKAMKSNPKLARRYEPGDIQAGMFGNEEEELDFIVGRMRELHETDFTDRRNIPFSISWSDMAVLTRTNSWASKIIDRLERGGIPAVASSGESIFERPEVQFALDCLSYVFRTERFGRDGRILPDAKYLRNSYSAIFPRERFSPADPSLFVRNIEQIRGDMIRLSEKDDKDYLPGLGLQEIYHRILQAAGADRFDFGEVYSYNLAALSQAVSDYESVWVRLRASEVKYFFNFVSAYGDDAYQDPRHSDQGLVDAVRIMTIHKAKGLEFPVVFIPDFVDKRRPNETQTFVDRNLYNSDRYRGGEEDERRVYYTALTRSEKYIFMTGSRTVPDRKKPRDMHRFLGEMPAKYVSGASMLSRSRSGYPPRLRATGEYETSYSEMISYLRCPEDFLLRNIYGFNAGVPAAFGYGTNIHNVLNMIHRQYIREGRVPDEKEIESITQRMFRLRYATREMERNMMESAIKVIQRYVKIHSRDFSRILETEKRFEFVLDSALINGQIDLLKKLDSDGAIKQVEIIDFKTEKLDGAYSADYERQLRYYAIACLESLNMKPEKAFVHHLDQDDPSKAFTEVDISEPRLQAAKNEIKTVVSKITGREFPPSPSSSKCAECDYNRICSYGARS
ncbi:MAG: ATP-dependent DNA helicase [Cuniculiplasma divulgatum]|jgi:DNA helicase-2/ATP-dependent DNA helicase PcrA|nr:MAG: ATP-dependent DNA helicase [Cuniculiplasma divulgatum]